jgi:hypothetical protein
MNGGRESRMPRPALDCSVIDDDDDDDDDMALQKVTEFYTQWSAFVPTEPQNIATSQYLKLTHTVNIKLIGMSMFFYCTKLRLSL